VWMTSAANENIMLESPAGCLTNWITRYTRENADKTVRTSSKPFGASVGLQTQDQRWGACCAVGGAIAVRCGHKACQPCPNQDRQGYYRRRLCVCMHNRDRYRSREDETSHHKLEFGIALSGNVKARATRADERSLTSIF
jgi:hypothetical protein